MKTQSQIRGTHRGGRGGRAPHQSSSPAPSAAILYKCALGGEMRPLHAFSNHQRQRAGIGRRTVDPLACGMICQEHTNPSHKEKIQCQGSCRQVLSLDHFSKSTRRNREFVCMLCRSWIENEPTPSGGSSDWSNDEDVEYRIVYPDAQQDSKFAEAEEEPLAPVTGTLDIVTSTITGDQDIHSETTQQGYMPSHLRGGQQSTTGSLQEYTGSEFASIDKTTELLQDGSGLLVPAPYKAGRKARLEQQQPADELSSIAPNPWYEKAGDNSATGDYHGTTDMREDSASAHQTETHMPTAVKSWTDKAQRFLAEGSQVGDFLKNHRAAIKAASDVTGRGPLYVKSANRDPRAKKAPSAWGDDGHTHRVKTSETGHHLEKSVRDFVGKDNAGVKDASTNELFRPRKANYQSELAWLDAQPETVFDDPYASDHEN